MQIPIKAIVAILALLPPVASGQVTCEISYKHQNQVDYSLRTRRAWGVAIDNLSTPVPKMCLGLFTEPDHRLISSVETNESGQFDFGTIKPGSYRLVANYDSFGAANVILDVGSWPSGGIWRAKLLFVHLRPSGIDTTSFVDWKRRGD
jgi:hypothetical protein